jgi:1-deoxy-D-xylulose-5-phosphate synthase
MSILDNIKTPVDLKAIADSELNALAREIRKRIIAVTSKNGGHIASNLGVVELTIALHYVFDMPQDKILWDVSHQSYAHKMLTGRNDFIASLRQDDGCLGFTSQQESEYDVFGAGHAGTAISAALGMAAARDRQNGSEKVIAVVGDGSLSCGISLEGLNNTTAVTKDFIIILNDNKMSISKNVGGITSHLNKIIPRRGYNRFRTALRSLILKIPRIGDKIRKTIGKIESATKSILVPSSFFEELGIRYIGPIDGHNIHNMIKTFALVKEFDTPVVVHVITEKGRGYGPAKRNPEKFHGINSFNTVTAKAIKNTGASYSSTFGQSIVNLAKNHEDVVAITAAMCTGTGLTDFANTYPNRFFDVGIAEEHAMVFAAGMASHGLRPVIAIYATFLQRALGCIFHDICLQNLPVIICADRSGIVNDGPTHHGIYDVSYLRTLPNISILYPVDSIELDTMLNMAYKQGSPVIIRYPKGEIPSDQHYKTSNIEWGKATTIKKGKDISIWATGSECLTALKVADILKQSGIESEVVNTMFLCPFDKQKLLSIAKDKYIATIEDNLIHGGLGSTVDEILINSKHQGVLHFGWKDEIVPHGTINGIKEKAELTPDKIANKIIQTVKGKKQ